MIRGTLGANNGNYYWECEILKSCGANANVRVGWSTNKTSLEVPVGHSRFSFAYRDLNGISQQVQSISLLGNM